MSTGNTFSDFAYQLMRREENLLKFMTLLENSFSSENDLVTMQFEKSDGSVEEVEVGSIAGILKKISTLEENFKQMGNINNVSNASVLLSDGTLRSVYLSDPVGEPKKFKVGEISSYFQRENYLKHLFSDPYTYLKVQVPRKDYPAYNSVIANKVLLTVNDLDKASYFEQNIKNVDIEYPSMKQILDNGSISYTETQIEIELSTSEYSKKGVFSVLNIVDKKTVSNNVTDDGVVYLLDTLFYVDKATNTDVLLKKNDVLFVGKSQYKIDFISESTNHVGVVRVSGYDPIVIGVDKMSYINTAQEQFVGLPINKNEFVIWFIKPVNPSSKIVSDDWGTGTAVNTDEILSGEVISNLWQSVSAIANESLVSAGDFIKPPSPQLLLENFKVVVINDHKSNSDSIVTIKQKFSDKQLAESNLKMVQEDIQKKNTALATTPPSDNATKNLLKSQLETLIKKQENVSREVSSKVNDLNATSLQLKGFKKKWNVIGFITEGAEAFDGNKIIKNIGYDTEYRYLSRDGRTKENESINVKKGEILEKGILPKWVKMPNPKIREKDIHGNWLTENIGEVDSFSITQISIPISENEIIEIRTRAISEAGYPLQLNYSDWSEPLQVEFPEGEDIEVDNIIELSKTSVVENNIIAYLTQKGVLRHNFDSVEITEKYYAHFLRSIGTDKLTPENKPIDAQTYIDSYVSRLLSLENIIGSLDGTISVRILAEDESLIAEVNRNGTIKYSEEFYKTLVEDFTVKKGTIINKTIHIEITNLSEGDIEILPYVTGIKDDKLIPAYTGYTFNNTEYNDFRQYFGSPIVRLDTITDAEFLEAKSEQYPFAEIDAFQSKQVKGQLLYSRKKDIKLNDDMWVDDTTPVTGGNSLPVFSGVNLQSFIWNGSQTTTPTVTGNGGLTDFAVHIDHPELKETSFYMQNWALYYDSGSNRTVPKQCYDSQFVYYPPFSMTDLASNNLSLKQLAYKDYESVSAGATFENFPSKTKFSDNDKYLIGSKTCGLYLTMASSEKLFTDETFSGSGIKVTSKDRILIPILASSRLTDYYGVGSTGIGNIGGQLGLTNISYSKKIGIDLVIKESKLELPKTFSFDFQYNIQYEKSSIN